MNSTYNSNKNSNSSRNETCGCEDKFSPKTFKNDNDKKTNRSKPS